MRGWLVILLLAAWPTAAAHGDRDVAQGTYTLEPGEASTWTRDLHWHRLMGTIASTQPVQLAVTGPEGEQEIAAGTSLRISHLVTCCQVAWGDHTFTLTNHGSQATDVAVDLALLHDNLAVLAHDAEPGGWWQTLLIVGAMVGIPAWRARQPPISAPAAPWIQRSRVAHAGTWAVALVLATIGMVRFRTGPLTGSLGATQPFPGGAGGFLNTHSFVMLALMAGWGSAVAFWGGARRRMGSPRAYAIDGWAFAAGSVVVGVVLGLETDLWAIPLALGLLPAAALVADAALQGRQVPS